MKTYYKSITGPLITLNQNQFLKLFRLNHQQQNLQRPQKSLLQNRLPPLIYQLLKRRQRRQQQQQQQRQRQQQKKLPQHIQVYFSK